MITSYQQDTTFLNVYNFLNTLPQVGACKSTMPNLLLNTRSGVSKSFGKDVCRLHLARIVEEVQITRVISLTNKVAINFNMFGVLVKHRILGFIWSIT